MKLSTTSVVEGKKENRFLAFLKKLGNKIVNYFKPLGEAMAKGDIFTKLSFLISGFGFFFHHQRQTIYERSDPTDERVRTIAGERVVVQWLRGLFYLALEALAILALVFWGIPNFKLLSLTELVPQPTLENGLCEIDPMTFDQVCQDVSPTNSFLIVLFSLITILILIFFLFVHIASIKSVYAEERKIKEGRHIRTAKEDILDLLDEHFYKTPLTLPIIGVVVFTLLPTLMMILIAFTNLGAKDANNANITMENFQWVGGSNWVELFSLGNGSNSFLMVFGSQLLWTLVWALLATLTCFFGGLLLALLLNSKRTRVTKVWRTGFVLTIAVPQFVSLMLIRYFLHDEAIVNNILVSWGLNPIPFLSDPWVTKVTIIVVNCWVGFPYLMLMISGILLNIPADLYESARIDGAGKMRMFWSITMPYIMQVCTPYLISSFVSNINNFNVIYLLTCDAPSGTGAYQDVVAKESDLLITWLYNMISDGSQPKYYMASIVGIIMFTISTIFTLVTFTQSTKGNRERRLG